METMNALAANYAALFSEIRPEVSHDEEQNQASIRRLEELTSKKPVTRAEEKLIELVAGPAQTKAAIRYSKRRVFRSNEYASRSRTRHLFCAGFVR
jgi:hypothetical protein